MARLDLVEPSVEELEFRRREGSPVPNLQKAVAHAPEVARHQLEFLRATSSGMPPREKELIILIVSLLHDNAYCWGHHVPPGIDAGLTETEILGVRAGDHSMLPPRDQALLAYCAAVVEQKVTDALWDAVARDRSPEEMVKITMLTSIYCMLSKLQGALHIPQDDGFGGFEVP